MSTQEQPQGKPQPNNIGIIYGRIIERRRSTDHFYTVVAIPAPDEYSAPMFAEIRSEKSIGDKDTEVKVPVRLGGFRAKPFTYSDKETGERITRRPVNNAFIAIEQ